MLSKGSLLLLSALLSSLCSLTFAIVGGRFAKPPPPDDPVVFTNAFNLDARCEGFRNPRNGIYSFLGIHYAEPPIDELRYSRPVYKRMAGDMNATSHGPPCIQPDPRQSNRIIGSENCLLLNVYTPQMPDESTGLPVLLWIHPGGYRYGSAAQYDATPMAQQGVVVVAPQYRLGTLGLLGDGTKEFDGNLAMFDLALALRWVNDYIKYFGGDPKRVQAIGHGSGGASAMYLSMSPTGRSGGDVNSVVAMSGTALSQYALDKEPVQSVQEIAEINGCPTGNELEIVQCMRAKPAEEIILNDSKVQTERLAGREMMKGLAGGNGFQPHIEGVDDLRGLPGIIKEEPEQMLRNARTTPVPLLTGVTKHETGNAVSIESITRNFGSAEGFLGSLTDTLMQLSSFLSLDKAGNLLKANLPGLTSAVTPSLQQFLSIPKSLDVTQVLAKVVDSSTDVLFSLPAVLTTQVWAQLAPSFMYSFEHNGTKSSGVNFLRGMPVVAEADASKAALVTHGDELGYMFDVNDIFGNPMPDANLIDDRDLKVRKNFIGMLVEFAKSAGGAEGANKGLFKAVTGKSVPFIKVDQDVKAENNFRFCELSMLGASLAPLGDISCAGVLDQLGAVGNLGGATSAVGGLLGGNGGGNGGLLGGGGSGGGGTKKPSGGVLGGLGLG